MAKATQKTKINKSAWIREQPATLTARELVERAEKQGIKITQPQVYTARSDANKAKGAPEKVSGTAPVKVKGKPGRKPKATAPASDGNGKIKINKSAWIREQPDSLSAKEVVEKAQKEDIAITIQQVYTARHSAKAKTEGSTTALTAPVKGKPGRKPKTAAGSAAAPTVRQDIIKYIMRVGTDEMHRILDQVEAGQVSQ